MARRRRNVRIARGRSFAAAGRGRRGPYAVGTYRIRSRTYLKATAGSRGVTAGLKYSGRRLRASAGYNFSSRRPYASLRRRKR